MTRPISKSYLALAILSAAWLTAQIVLVCIMQKHDLVSDALRYVTLASDSLKQGALYPTLQQIEWAPVYDDHHPAYVCYAGLINYFSLCLWAFGTWKAILWLNIALNCVTAASIWKIARTIGGRKVAMITTALFMLSPQPVNLAALCMPEVPFMALTFASLALLCNRSVWSALAGGILLAAGCYIRPVALLFALAAVLYLIFSSRELRKTGVYVSTAAACILAVVAMNRHNTDHTFFSSSTLGVNMFIGANDDCRGYYNNASAVSDRIDSISKGCDVFELEEIQKEHALRWIKEHPAKWAMLAPRKIFCQLKGELYDYYATHGIADIGRTPDRVVLAALHWYAYIYTAILLVLAAAGLVLRRRRLLGTDGIVLLPLLGGLALAVLTVGAPRYNMPFLPIFGYFASFAVLWIYGALLHRKI